MKWRQLGELSRSCLQGRGGGPLPAALTASGVCLLLLKVALEPQAHTASAPCLLQQPLQGKEVAGCQQAPATELCVSPGKHTQLPRGAPVRRQHAAPPPPGQWCVLPAESFPRPASPFRKPLRNSRALGPTRTVNFPWKETGTWTQESRLLALSLIDSGTLSRSRLPFCMVRRWGGGGWLGEPLRPRAPVH